MTLSFLFIYFYFLFYTESRLHTKITFNKTGGLKIEFKLKYVSYMMRPRKPKQYCLQLVGLGLKPRSRNDFA